MQLDESYPWTVKFVTSRVAGGGRYVIIFGGVDLINGTTIYSQFDFDSLVLTGWAGKVELPPSTIDRFHEVFTSSRIEQDKSGHRIITMAEPDMVILALMAETIEGSCIPAEE